jgi:NAD(P)-dependent dehydrogenase (short-subunit alcohol dehydrogenase family)
VTGLTDRVVLVTGAASGLGAATARVLAAAGAAVVIADIAEPAAKKVAADIESAGGRAAAAMVDLTVGGQIEEVVRAATEQHGRLDALINNAGIDRTVGVGELRIEEWDRILAVNLRAPFIASKHALEVMKRQGFGHIVNITSTAAKRAWANASAYHASKWGLLGFSHALHTEARPHNVKVTAVVSGGMQTPFLLERFPDLDLGTLQDPRNVAETIRFVLMQPNETVIPEVLVLPMRETSWP